MPYYLQQAPYFVAHTQTHMAFLDDLSPLHLLGVLFQQLLYKILGKVASVAKEFIIKLIVHG